MNLKHKNDKVVHVVGGGLAGSEAAWQLSQLGIGVRL
ncbi:MAG: FAD-dependent oxidoreductase, partial [Rhodospirillales bacterium]|nr:FAD-dependent oxidoreductase [Rhodospirillales bacterium]